MGSIFKKEPALIIGALMALIALLVTFGLPISAEQQKALEDALWLVLPLIGFGAVATRQSVVAPANVGALVKDGQLVAGDAATVPNETPVTVMPSPPVDNPFPEGH